jgi:hypothetical protein
MSVLASRNVVQCRLTNRTSCCRMCWASHCRGTDTADVPLFERMNCILRLLRMQGVSRSNSRRDRLFPQNNTWIFLEGSWMLINLSPIWRIYHSLFSYPRYQWPRACWDCEFESRRGHECLSVVSVVYCKVEVSATNWSLVQRSPTECGVSECDQESSIMRRPWPTGGCWAMVKKKLSLLSHNTWSP